MNKSIFAVYKFKPKINFWSCFSHVSKTGSIGSLNKRELCGFAHTNRAQVNQITRRGSFELMF